MKILQTEFIGKQSPVTLEEYENMLGALPPRAMTTNAFLVGEPYDHDKQGFPRYSLYFTHEDKYYYGGLATLKDFQTFLVPAKSLNEMKTDEERNEWLKDAEAGKVVRIT